MSMSFNATTSKAEATGGTAYGVTTLSILVWVHLTGLGEGGNGVIIASDESGNAWCLRTKGSGNPLRFYWNAATAIGAYDIAALPTGVDVCIALTFDPATASVVNGGVLPTIYTRVVGTDSNLVSRTVIPIQYPVGTMTTPNSGVCIGNLSDQSQTTDGEIAFCQTWTSIVSSGNLDTAMRTQAYSTNRDSYWNDSGTDSGSAGRNLTLTSVTTGSYPTGIPEGAAAAYAFPPYSRRRKLRRLFHH